MRMESHDKLACGALIVPKREIIYSNTKPRFSWPRIFGLPPPPPTMVKINTMQHGYYGEGSVDVSPSQPGEGPIRRCAISKDKLVTQPLEGIDTVADIISYSARTHGNRNALGWRDTIRIVEEEKEVTKIIDGKEVAEKKLWKYFELSDYKFLSYVDLKEAVSEVSRALIDLGITKDDVFNVYAQTRYVTACSVATLIDSISH